MLKNFALSPQRRHSSGQPLELEHVQQLEEIAESGEQEEGSGEDLHHHQHHQLQHFCNAAKDFHCLRGGEPLYESELHEAVKVVCNNSSCPYSNFMHAECFEVWQESVLNFLKTCGRARSWSEKQRVQNLWTKRGYDLAYKACACRCQHGHLRKDLNWIPPRPQHSSTDSDSDKQRRRKRKNSKNSKPALTIGLPTFTLVPLQGMKRSDAQGIPPLSRIRTNSVSSTASGSSSFSSSVSSPAASPPSDCNIPPRRTSLMDRSRHDSGGSIFLRRSDYSSFNVLPKHKINSYHIKMEDECSIGNDETRCFILSNYATNKMNRVPCVLCNSLMYIFERYPLIDGTFFLSPRQHTKACIQVKMDGRSSFLSAVCMGCLEGWTASLLCRFCLQPWDGSQLILGTMYSYDIFAAVPCCAERLKCTNCSQLVIHPDQRFNFFSDYSQTVSCPHCGVQDFHFTKPLNTFVSRDELTKAAASNQQLMGRSWAAAVRS